MCAYVYDRATLRSNARTLRAALPAGALLCYAIKANAHPDVVATLAAEVDGLEVASAGELAIATAAGAARTTAAGAARTTAAGAPLVLFAGPAKTDEELVLAIRAGVVVNAESVHELHRLAHAARRLDQPVRVALRVNRLDGGPPAQPSIADTARLRMAGGPTPFGIDEAALPAAVAVARAEPRVKLVGFHLHGVSNNLDAAGHANFVTEAVRWSVATANTLGVPLELVNVGGGFGVDYTGEQPFDLDVLRIGLAGLPAALPAGARLVFEPGRLLAAAAGSYAVQVLDLKQTHGRWFAVVRGGTHHFRLPAAWGYSHPFTVVPVDAWPYPFPRPTVEDCPVDVVGELCTPKDVLARDAPVRRLRAGDLLVFPNTGAYGWEISHHDFLRHRHPEFVVL